MLHRRVQTFDPAVRSLHPPVQGLYRRVQLPNPLVQRPDLQVRSLHPPVRCPYLRVR